MQSVNLRYNIHEQNILTCNSFMTKINSFTSILCKGSPTIIARNDLVQLSFKLILITLRTEF